MEESMCHDGPAESELVRGGGEYFIVAHCLQLGENVQHLSIDQENELYP
jgi:hypothetical protein